jgi:hypothetical protein
MDLVLPITSSSWCNGSARLRRSRRRRSARPRRPSGAHPPPTHALGAFDLDRLPTPTRRWPHSCCAGRPGGSRSLIWSRRSCATSTARRWCSSTRPIRSSTTATSWTGCWRSTSAATSRTPRSRDRRWARDWRRSRCRSSYAHATPPRPVRRRRRDLAWALRRRRCWATSKGHGSSRSTTCARHQFGQRIGDFQAVQFQIADAVVAEHGLAELALFTIWRISEVGAAARDALRPAPHAADVVRRHAHRAAVPRSVGCRRGVRRVGTVRAVQATLRPRVLGSHPRRPHRRDPARRLRAVVPARPNRDVRGVSAGQARDATRAVPRNPRSRRDPSVRRCNERPEPALPRRLGSSGRLPGDAGLRRQTAGNSAIPKRSR